MKVVIDVPKDFTGDYIADKFKDFFSRVIADIDCKGMCGRYEKEIAEMFLKAFNDSEEKISCNCQHNSNSRDNESCCKCGRKKTNADRIRNMSDEELAEFLITFKNTFGEEYEGEASCMEWIQSEAE
jgi:hypothetical protein